MGTGNYDVNANLVPQIWEKSLYRNAQKRLFFMRNGLMGEGSNNIIQMKTDLRKEKGDNITMGITGKLTGDGVDGDDELEGNEENITGYDQNVKIGQRRNAVRVKGKLTEQKAMYNMRSDSRDKLGIWSAEFLERQLFMKLAGVNNITLTDVNGKVVGRVANWVNTSAYIPDAHTAAGVGARYLCANSSGAASLGSTDILTPGFISKLKAKAKQIDDPAMIPLDIDGSPHYVYIIHTRQAYDLTRNAEWTQAQREAGVRGKKNPIFTGALGMWDNVIVYESDFIPFLDISVALHSFRGPAVGTDFSADTYRSLFCGQQAGCIAYGKYENAWVEKDFDYKNKAAVATGMMLGVQKTLFNSKEYGVIAADTAATAV